MNIPVIVVVPSRNKAMSMLSQATFLCEFRGRMSSFFLGLCWLGIGLSCSMSWAGVTTDRMTTTARVPLRQAEQHLNRGMELASRGAVHSAAAEFQKTLTLVASAADVRTRSQQHITALTEGLEALIEAEDFLIPSQVSNVSQTMNRIIEGHQTPVFHSTTEADAINPLTAMQEYYFYARDRLADAGANEPIASYALYGLGRLQPHVVAEDATPNPILDAKMLAYYRAAIRIWPQNNRAANEIGVLLARIGDLNAAEQAFQHSYSIAAQPKVWQNLQKVRALRRQPNQFGNRLNNIVSTSYTTPIESAIRWVEPSMFGDGHQPLIQPSTNRPTVSKKTTE